MNRLVTEFSLSSFIETRLNIADKSEQKVALQEIREKIQSLKLPKDIAEDLKSQLDSPVFSGFEFFAVRSSAVGEDSKQASFAGQMDSYLFQKGIDSIEKSIVNCLASIYTDRAYFYRLQKGLPLTPRGAVIVQAMIDADVSGVFFTAHPVNGRRDMALATACYGSGEGVVSGVCNADEFTIQLNSGEVVEETIVDKDIAIVFDHKKGCGTVEVKVDEAKRKQSCINNHLLKELTKICREIASHYGYAQDIEWSIRKNKIYILQTRPVTSLPDPATAKGTKIVWDNSNIQESYNGVTTPLTFSFANRAYRDVYTQTMKVLKVSDKQIKDHEYVLANLLGLVKGRVYYNINNWYRGLLLAPSFKTNKADMERMMGLSDPVDFVKDTESSLLEKLIKMPRMLLILFSMLNSFIT